MADLSITISNRLRVKPQVFDGQPSLWGTMVWGTDYWWGLYDTTFLMDKGIADSLSLSLALDKRTDKWLSESMNLSQALGVTYGKTLPNTMSMSVVISRYVSQGDWTRDEPDLVDWSEIDDGSTTWTELDNSGPNWSES